MAQLSPLRRLPATGARGLLAPFVDQAWIGGAFTPREQHSPESAAAIKVSDELVAEIKAADEIVIGTPMFNFSIPAVLKAYIDQIVRVGVTVSPNNVGLITGKKATVILASGGDFSPGSPVEKYNQASGYLRQVLAWIGIKDVEFILFLCGYFHSGYLGYEAAEGIDWIWEHRISDLDQLGI